VKSKTVICRDVAVQRLSERLSTEQRYVAVQRLSERLSTEQRDVAVLRLYIGVVNKG
jgi:hypothetical protein